MLNNFIDIVSTALFGGVRTFGTLPIVILCTVLCFVLVLLPFIIAWRCFK